MKRSTKTGPTQRSLSNVFRNSSLGLWFEGLANKGRHAKGRALYRGVGASTGAERKRVRERKIRRNMARESRRRNRT